MKKTIEKDDLSINSRETAEKMKYFSELLVWLNQEYGTKEIEMIFKQDSDTVNVKITLDIKNKYL